MVVVEEGKCGGCAVGSLSMESAAEESRGLAQRVEHTNTLR